MIESTSNKYRLAIVVPYYNERFFRYTLDSLVSQTDKRFVVYIGNDASPDDPIRLIESYHNAGFSIVYHKFEHNLGGQSLPKQWARCIELTMSEEWIMILGDDDVLSDNVVGQFYSSLEEIDRHGIHVVNFSTQVIDDNGVSVGKKYELPRICSSIDCFFRKIDGGGRGSLSEHIFRRISYEKYGFKDYTLGWHSDDMAVMEFSNFKNIYSIDSATVFVRLGADNISGKTDNEKFKIQASQQFYEDLLIKYAQNFTPKQRLVILYAVEYCESISKKRNPKIKKINIYRSAEGLLGIVRFLKRSFLG